MSTTYFTAEDAIINALQTNPLTATLFKKVAGWTELETALDSLTATPAALVVFLGDSAAAANKNTPAISITQEWGVVLIVRAARTKDGAENTREAAGALILAAAKALNGLAIDPRHTPLQFGGVEDVSYFAGTLARFTLKFSTTRPL